MKSTSIFPLFCTKDRTPFVFWDANQNRLLIRHGKKFTIIYYDEAVPHSCFKPLLYRRKMEIVEELIYNSSGKVVASYLPDMDCLVIKRDGNILSFSAPNRPVGYSDCFVDKVHVTSFYPSSE